ncbi:MAG: hypothetical protein ABL929_12215 [Ferruginibacter sp.]|nr:hypothetical protein [Ferruginibacter sp.]
MHIFKNYFSLIGAFIISTTTFAQEVDLTKGDLTFLKDQSSINVEFTYEKLAVGDFSKEADYIKSKTVELNTKEAGTGDTWAKKWENDKIEKFGPKFILGLTKLLDVTINKDAKYTLIFNTKAIEPGYSIGISKRNAGIDGTVILVETTNRTKKLAVLSVDRPGENMFRGAAFDAASRIGDAFFLSGQKVGKFIKKANK